MRILVDDPRNIGEIAENEKVCGPYDRPVLLPRYANLIIYSTLLIVFGHRRRGSGGFELRGIEVLGPLEAMAKSGLSHRYAQINIEHGPLTREAFFQMR